VRPGLSLFVYDFIQGPTGFRLINLNLRDVVPDINAVYGDTLIIRAGVSEFNKVALVFEGYLRLPHTVAASVRLRTDGTHRLYINGVEAPSATASVSFTAGALVAIRVEYVVSPSGNSDKFQTLEMQTAEDATYVPVPRGG
jgi:hypothetical protein